MVRLRAGGLLARAVRTAGVALPLRQQESTLRRMSDRLPTLYALIWRSTATDDEADPADFEARVPAVMAWLRDLHARGVLVACGGGGFENHSGGLTLVRCDTVEDALAIAESQPLNDIGSTEVLVWDVYYASLDVPRVFAARA